MWSFETELQAKRSWEETKAKRMSNQLRDQPTIMELQYRASRQQEQLDSLLLLVGQLQGIVLELRHQLHQRAPSAPVDRSTVPMAAWETAKTVF